MNSFITRVSIVVALFALIPLQANDLVQFPKGSAAWTIDVTNSQNSKATNTQNKRDIVKVEVTQSDKFRRSLVTFSNGLSRPSWDVPGLNVILTQGSNGVPFVTPPTRYFSIPYLPSVFDWVSADALQEKTAIYYQSKLCFHYKAQAGEAWIESKTSLPVAFDDGVSLATFTFHPPPTTPLELPPQYKQLLSGYEAFSGKH